MPPAARLSLRGSAGITSTKDDDPGGEGCGGGSPSNTHSCLAIAYWQSWREVGDCLRDDQSTGLLHRRNYSTLFEKIVIVTVLPVSCFGHNLWAYVKSKHGVRSRRALAMM